MENLKKILNFFLALTLVISAFCGFSLYTQAAEKNNTYLPEGWRSLELIDLKDIPEIDIKNTIQTKAPAPALTSLQIIDLAIDEKNEIHVVTQEIGTSRAGTSLTWYNGSQCKENIYEQQILWGSDNIAYGYIKYFHTGVYYSPSVVGHTVTTKAQATNAMNPWNTLSTSRAFIIP